MPVYLAKAGETFAACQPFALFVWMNSTRLGY